jgi:putative acetyltransferase
MMEIRSIRPEDNDQLAAVIRLVMKEFNVDPATTILGDPTLDHMYETYQAEKAVYYVALLDQQLVGGCGIKALDGSAENICELQRLFLHPAARGRGIGKQLMELCLQKAEEFAFQEIYLETLQDMHAARALYEQYGFQKICSPKGQTGHGGCDVWMMRSLQDHALHKEI